MARKRLPAEVEISQARRYVVMVALALGGFGIGVTEFASMGLLPLIASDFQITEEQAGGIISAYALGVVLGAPLIAALTGHLPRRRLLLLLMVAFAVGNAAAIATGSYSTLMVARFVAGVPHGAYFSVSGLAAAAMAPRGQRGKAMAFVGMGLPLATVIGVPVAQAVGQHFGWRTTYGAIALIGCATLLSLWFLMPHMTTMRPTNPLTELSSLRRLQVWLSLAIGAVGFGGMFAVYTYITWTMTDTAGLDPSWMWLVLMTYGIGMVVGTFVGGRLSDWNVEFGIAIALIAIGLTLVTFYFASSIAWLGTLNFGLIGFSGSLLVPSLQLRLIDVAGKAKTLAAALSHSALNIANGAGAAFGGAVIAAGFGYSAPAVAGAALAVVALVIWALAWRLRR